VDHLLEKAVKYSPGGGSIEVTLQLLQAAAGAAQAKERFGMQTGHEDIGTRESQLPHQVLVEFTVSDQRMGIPSEHLGWIFETFHRVDTRRRREVDGLGLGLAMCRRLMELHDGVIWGESEPGKGSVFHLLLPAAEMESERGGSA